MTANYLAVICGTTVFGQPDGIFTYFTDSLLVYSWSWYRSNSIAKYRVAPVFIGGLFHHWRIHASFRWRNLLRYSSCTIWDFSLTKSKVKLHAFAFIKASCWTLTKNRFSALRDYPSSPPIKVVGFCIVMVLDHTRKSSAISARPASFFVIRSVVNHHGTILVIISFLRTFVSISPSCHYSRYLHSAMHLLSLFHSFSFNSFVCFFVLNVLSLFQRSQLTLRLHPF